MFPIREATLLQILSICNLWAPPLSASDRIGKPEPGGKQGPRPEVRALERAGAESPRDRERETETERERERQTDREGERDTDTDAQRDTEPPFPPRRLAEKRFVARWDGIPPS